VLDHLHEQEGVNDIQWEVLVVDNNSTDATGAVVQEEQEDWKREAPLRYAFEERQGKSYALQTAVDEAYGTWVAFLDDDNLPAPDWVAAAHRFAEAHPQAGAFGGQVHGRFEEEPPTSFGLVKPLFALNERTDEICYSSGDSLQFAAPGAGLAVRREAWMESVPKTGLELKGPTGDSRGTLGEEFELQWRLYQNGWDIWHNPRMHLEHRIPSERLEEGYLEDFFKAIGRSRYWTRMMRFEPWERPLATVAYWGADLWKLARLCWTYRNKIRTDRFVRGRVWMTLHMLVAPFSRR
jgi:glycosyltransferase involved in cell wall biosynthesis